MMIDWTRMRSSSDRECRRIAAKRQTDAGRLIGVGTIERSIGLSGWLAGGVRASFEQDRGGAVILSFSAEPEKPKI